MLKSEKEVTLLKLYRLIELNLVPVATFFRPYDSEFITNLKKVVDNSFPDMSITDTLMYITELSTTGKTSCKKCPPNKHCPVGSSVLQSCALGKFIDNNICENCPVGHFCPEGSSTPKPCPVGTFQSLLNKYSQNACIPCENAKYCPGNGFQKFFILEISSNIYRNPTAAKSVSPTACPFKRMCFNQFFPRTFLKSNLQLSCNHGYEKTFYVKNGSLSFSLFFEA